MIRHVVIIMAFAAMLTACGTADKEKLQSQVDSLRNELETSQEMARTLNEVGVLMDSIDANRQALRLNMVEGSTYDDYVNRMQGLNSYVRDTQDKIDELEKALKKSKSSNNAFAATIKKLKADIESRNAEIAGLKETIEKYKSENQNLIQVTEMQELDILDKQEQIESKKRELTFLEQRIDEVLSNAKVNEADGYFARAQAVEETAKRTKLAPKKKKASLNQALELYRKALSMGSDKAKAEIERLEKELK